MGVGSSGAQGHGDLNMLLCCTWGTFLRKWEEKEAHIKNMKPSGVSHLSEYKYPFFYEIKDLISCYIFNSILDH